MIIFAAIFIPILLDDNGSAFIPNSLCVIFGNSGGNFTCDNTNSNVTFTGVNGITIYPNGTNEIIWNFTGQFSLSVNGTTLIPGDQIDFNIIGANLTEIALEPCADDQILIWYTLTEWTCIDVSSVNQTQTHFSLGGDADVFKFENSTHVAFRGISEGIGMNVTERTNDILVALKDCNNLELLVFNGTTGDYQCISGADFSSQVAFDTDEIFYPWVGASSTGVHVILSMTNYDIRAVRETGVGVSTSATTWVWPVPTNFDNTSNVKFTLYWITQSGSAGTVCHSLSTMPRVEGNNIDSTFGTVEKVCTANPGSNILVVDEFILTPAEHNYDPDDLGFIKLSRDPTDSSDTLTTNAYILVGKLEWNA